ncbi:MAG: hypothetical protein HXO94_04645 [Streptococcus sp.]|nr:hypothetical protein [Streptococcus sp.]
MKVNYSPQFRTVNVEEFSKLLYFHYKARYDLYNNLGENEENEVLLDKWISLYKDHSFISDAGISTFSKNNWEKMKATLKSKSKNTEIKWRKNYRFFVDFMSSKAWEELRTNGLNDENGKSKFRYEHMVPKHEYIEKEIQEMALNNKLDLKKIEELVSKYYYLALILIEEDKKLSRKMMPENWNREDFYSRYEKAGIDLINNPLYEGLE